MAPHTSEQDLHYQCAWDPCAIYCVVVCYFYYYYYYFFFLVGGGGGGGGGGGSTIMHILGCRSTYGKRMSGHALQTGGCHQNVGDTNNTQPFLADH